MKLVGASIYSQYQPFRDGPYRCRGQAEDGFDSTIVRLETGTGLVGWGESFSYTCRRAVQAAVEDMIAPVAVGADAVCVRPYAADELRARLDALAARRQPDPAA